MSTGDRPAKKLPADAPEVAARVRSAMQLVRMTAIKVRRQLGGSLELDELEAMGREGLLEAARTFAPDHGVPFPAWGYLKIRGAIFDGIRRQSVLPREVYRALRALDAAKAAREGQIEDEAAGASESAEAADQRIASTASSMAMAMAAAFLGARSDTMDQARDEKDSPEEAAMRSNLLDKVRAAIAKLPENEATLMNAYYFEDATLEEAGKRLGLSKSWGCRLHARALETIASQIREQTENELPVD
ncbi:MAG: sigma-70 family RNA polymerase sigma factor [Polyangiaceae bacterium]